MLTFETTDDFLVVHMDEEDAPITPQEVVEALEHSIDVDFVGMENEGAPSSMGNDYAEYRAKVLMPRLDGKVHTFGIGQMEADELNQDWETHIRSYPLEKVETLSLSRPSVGFVTLTVGDTDICGVSYINPFLLEDIADFVDAMADREHSVSMCLDCEGHGMAYLTAIEAETLTVVRDDGLNGSWLADDMAEAIRELADSVEENADAWLDWADDEDEDEQAAKARIEDDVRRMRLAAERLGNNNETPAETMRLWLGLAPSELTEEDGELLMTEMRSMVAKTRSLSRTSVQGTWRINDETSFVHSTPEGRLRAVRVTVDSHYFEDRQLAFVRDDGCVEYGGWCDAKNMAPIREAFRNWCKTVRRLHAERDA